MNTHIIIPISLIEERIKLAEKEEEICKQSDFELAGQAARNRVSFYKILLGDKNLKQISLDENNIREQATNYTNMDNNRETAKWNADQFVVYDIKPRVKNIPKETEKFLRKKLLLKIMCERTFAYEQALKDLL